MTKKTEKYTLFDAADYLDSIDSRNTIPLTSGSSDIRPTKVP